MANPGDPIVATWSAPPGQSATDWVGLFAVGETDNHNDFGRAYTNGTVTGKAVFPAPDQPGQCEDGYLKADSFTDLAVTSSR